MQTAFILQAIAAIEYALTVHELEIAELDRAIGDGDHYINIKRGALAIVAMQAELADISADAALQKIGMKVMSSVGGASGVLIGSFFLAFGKTLQENGGESLPEFAAGFAAGVESIRQRGKSDLGEKTMLDVLIPVARQFSSMAIAQKTSIEIATALKLTATTGMLATKDLLATKGRAAFLGVRSKNHIDAGAKSSEVMIHAVSDLVLQDKL